MAHAPKWRPVHQSQHTAAAAAEIMLPKCRVKCSSQPEIAHHPWPDSATTAGVHCGPAGSESPAWAGGGAIGSAAADLIAPADALHPTTPSADGGTNGAASLTQGRAAALSMLALASRSTAMSSRGPVLALCGAALSAGAHFGDRCLEGGPAAPSPEAPSGEARLLPARGAVATAEVPMSTSPPFPVASVPVMALASEPFSGLLATGGAGAAPGVATRLVPSSLTTAPAGVG